METSIRNVIQSARQAYALDLGTGQVPQCPRYVFHREENGYRLTPDLGPDYCRWASTWETGREEEVERLRLQLFEVLPQEMKELLLEHGRDKQLLAPIAFASVRYDMLNRQLSEDDIVEASLLFFEREMYRVFLVYGIQGISVDAPAELARGVRVFTPEDEDRGALQPPYAMPLPHNHVYGADALLHIEQDLHRSIVHQGNTLDCAVPYLRSLLVSASPHIGISGPISLGAVYYDAFMAGMGASPMQGPGRDICYSRLRDRSVSFDANRVALAREVMDILGDEKGRCGRAAYRIERAGSRLDDVDRLVDYIIALETLLTSGGEQGEVGYRLRMRTARVVATPERRTEIRKFIRDVYSLRSKVIHGERADGLRETVDRLGEVVRSTLGVLALHQKRKPDINVVDAIDHAMIGESGAVEFLEEIQLDPSLALP